MKELTQEGVAVADLARAERPSYFAVCVLCEEEGPGQDGTEEHGIVEGAGVVADGDETHVTRPMQHVRVELV